MAEVKAKPAIKKRKLSETAIHEVAKAIAEKAFEHQFASLNERRKALDERLYLAMFEAKSREQIEKCAGAWPAVLVESSKQLSLELMMPDGATHRWTITFDTPRVVPQQRGWRVGFRPKSALATVIDSFFAEQQRLALARSELQTSLRSQLQALGDTHTVIAYWPEVEPILAELYGDVTPDRSIVVTPLAALLGKFLPALPAPTLSEVA